MSQERRVSIIGAGLMGFGLAQVFAVANCRVTVFDNNPATLAGLRDRIAGTLADLGQDQSAVRNVRPCDTLEATVREAEFVFECCPEIVSLKQELFAQIEGFAPPDALLASNTSVIPVAEIMKRVADKSRALGTHWWNPPYLVPLVEVIRTADTTDVAMEAMTDFLIGVGKTPATVNKDIPGFIGNRLQHAMWREAIALVAGGICDAQTIDMVVKSSFGMRLGVLGPMENADLVGTDLALAAHNLLFPDLNRDQAASPYLAELVSKGRLGVSTGEGFLMWTDTEITQLNTRLRDHLLSATAGGPT